MMMMMMVMMVMMMMMMISGAVRGSNLQPFYTHYDSQSMAAVLSLLFCPLSERSNVLCHGLSMTTPTTASVTAADAAAATSSATTPHP